MQKLEGVTCCVLVAWQRWLPALPRWFPLLQAAAWLARAILQHSCKDISPSLMRSERGCCTFLRPALEAVAHDPMRRPRQRLLLKFELVLERLGPDAGNPAGVRMLAISTALSG